VPGQPHAGRQRHDAGNRLDDVVQPESLTPPVRGDQERGQRAQDHGAQTEAEAARQAGDYRHHQRAVRQHDQ